MKKFTLLLVIGALAYAAHQRANQAESSPMPVYEPESAVMDVEADTTKFQCDGRTRCREMRSCEEAEFFIANCPGTKMDGDGDGIPCEDQFCR
jgi:hypothetical protein